MTRDLLTMLEYEARRQPVVAALMADIHQLSEDDIRAAPVKLPWLRQALLVLKQQFERDALAASLDSWAKSGHTPDPLGEMRRWEGPDCFIRVGRSQLEIHSGQLIWCDSSGVWIDTIHCAAVDPALMRQSVPCGRVPRSAYMLAIREHARHLCPTPGTQPIERVRFYRPG